MTDVNTLTPRQRVILDLLSEGMVEKQVATYMGRSYETIKWHTKQIRSQLGANHTTHAVAIYLRTMLSERQGTQAYPPAQGKPVGRMAAGAVTPQRRPSRSESIASPHGNPKEQTPEANPSPSPPALP
jgi:DNA-binding CsgD family transcriptional regulator